MTKNMEYIPDLAVVEDAAWRILVIAAEIGSGGVKSMIAAHVVADLCPRSKRMQYTHARILRDHATAVLSAAGLIEREVRHTGARPATMVVVTHVGAGVATDRLRRRRGADRGGSGKAASATKDSLRLSSPTRKVSEVCAANGWGPETSAEIASRWAEVLANGPLSQAEMSKAIGRSKKTVARQFKRANSIDPQITEARGGGSAKTIYQFDGRPLSQSASVPVVDDIESKESNRPHRPCVPLDIATASRIEHGFTTAVRANGGVATEAQVAMAFGYQATASGVADTRRDFSVISDRKWMFPVRFTRLIGHASGGLGSVYTLKAGARGRAREE